MNRTTNIIEAGITEGLHPGAQIYVSRHGEVLFEQAWGAARPMKAMTTDSLVLWMSAVKPLTAVAIAQLVEAGQVDVEARVTEYVEEFGEGGKEEITVRHLLTHTGGFRGSDMGLPSADYERAVAHICKSKLEPRWVPGERAGYHAQGSWFILAEIVRRISGEAIDVYTRKNILQPIGVSVSGIGISLEEQESCGDRIAFMYNTADDEVEPFPVHSAAESVAAVNPAGNGRGPMRDLGRFYEMLVRGGEGVLKEETIELFTRRQRVGMEDASFGQVLDCGFGFIPNNYKYHGATGRYGYGPHASETSFGHGGSQSSVGFADPEHEVVVALAFNGMPGEYKHQHRLESVMEAVYEDLDLG